MITRELLGHRRTLGLARAEPAPCVRVTARALICRPSPAGADERDVLMVSPSHPGVPGTNFRLPGGPVTADEPAWEAVARTVAEETGLTVRPARLLVTDWARKGGGAEAGITFVYAVVPHDGDVDVRLPETPELAGYAWVPIGGLGERCSPHQARRVKAALDAARGGTLAELRLGSPAYAVAA
ncbi:NUDIX domain-containing protein [Streptomyces sp. CA-181903]|uniref:NUDIX domain-containing protein n=1 Tax=Streptomyces sp. CA-181903 TaxID=3240055 RepID=UPI003D9493DB